MDLVRPDWGGDLGTVSPLHFGHNTVWVRNGLGIWDVSAKPPRPHAAVLALVKGLRPGVLRFPGGTRAMRYHFAEAIGPLAGRKDQCDTFTGLEEKPTYGLDEFLRLAGQVGAQVTLVTPWNDAPPEEAAAMVAYVNARPDSTVALGKWGTAGDWARRRADNGHPDPYGVRFLEIGNEQYLLTPTPAPKVCGRPFRFCQCERWEGRRVPTTARSHADLVRKTGDLVKRVDKNIKIGASAYSRYDGSNAARAVSVMDDRLGTGDAWNATLVSLAGRSFDYFVLHPYNLPRAATGEKWAPITPLQHLALAERLRQSVGDLRALDRTKDIAVTEFGDYFWGGKFLGVLLTALITRVALEERLLMSLRHVLIEDRTTEPFAKAAAILPGPRKTAAYHAVRLLVENLTGRAIPAETHHPRLVAFATTEGSGGPITIALVRFHPTLPPGPTRLVQVALPPGQWAGMMYTHWGRWGLLSEEKQIARAKKAVPSAVGTLDLPVPPNALVIARLRKV
jgi:hypothetical protein